MAEQRDMPVQYDDSAHRYFVGTTTYISATQLLEMVIPPFNTQERAEYMAFRYGHTPEYWITKWRGISAEALNRGRRIHDEQEQLLYQNFIAMTPHKLRVRKVGTGTSYHMLPDGIYPEMKLWRHDYQLAGRSDKVTLRTPYRGWREADVDDYKTGARIAFRGYQDYGTGQIRMLDFPLQHLEDCEFTHYALQLSLYQYMLEWFGFAPGTRTLIHFPHPTDEFPSPRPVSHDLPYLRDDVIKLLKHYINVRDSTGLQAQDTHIGDTYSQRKAV